MKTKEEQNRDLLYKIGAKGRCMTVIFRKRTNNEIRTMNCILKSEKNLRGGVLSFDPKEKKIQIVYDLKSKGWRSISLDSIIEVRGAKKVFRLT